MSTKEKIEALTDIITHVSVLPVDDLDKAMLLKTAVVYFEARAQTTTMRDLLHKAILQSTQTGEIKFN